MPTLFIANHFSSRWSAREGSVPPGMEVEVVSSTETSRQRTLSCRSTSGPSSRKKSRRLRYLVLSLELSTNSPSALNFSTGLSDQRWPPGSTRLLWLPAEDAIHSTVRRTALYCCWLSDSRVHSLVWFILRPCQHDDGYIDGHSQIEVHADQWTQVYTAPGLPRWSPIQVLTEVDVPRLQLTCHWASLGRHRKP